MIVSGKISTTVLMLMLVPITVCSGIHFYRQKWLWIFPLAFAPALMFPYGDNPSGVVTQAFLALVVFWALYALVIYGVYRIDARMSRSTYLIKLVQQGKRDLVAASLQNGADANVTDGSGAPVLVHALGNMGIFKLLLEHGADASAAIKFSNAEGKPALVQALGDMEIFRLLLEHGADVNAADETGKTALMRAVELGNMEAAGLLLDKGANANASDKDSKTALLTAVEVGNMEAAALLLDKGANINAADGGGKTALMRAVEIGNMEATGLLLDKGADVNASNEPGKAVLLRALSGGKTEMLKRLLEHGADANVTDDKGVPALMLALNNMDMFKLLLEKGADINAADAHGQTPLVRAMKAKNVKAASLLLELGANLDIARDGDELLARAAQNNAMELARKLVSMGVNPLAASKSV